MFNPSEMTRERFVDQSKSAPIGHHFSQRLSMELFLDSSYWGNDETDIQPFLQDLERGSGLCTFYWGSFSFSGTVEALTVQYLKFLPNGIPTRAKILIVLFQAPVFPKAASESRSHQAIREYQSPANAGLWLAAWRAYEDPSRWREIAKANQIVNPRLVTPGQSLIIPNTGKDS